MRSTRLVLASAGLVVVAGCQSFTRIEPATVNPGAAIRITLDREETLRQADRLGQLQSVINGVATDASDGSSLSLTYRLPSPTPTQPNRFNGLMTVPWANIVQVEKRHFSAGKTVGLVAVGAAITVAILVVNDESGGGPSEGGPTPNAAIIPLLRWVW